MTKKIAIIIAILAAIVLPSSVTASEEEIECTLFGEKIKETAEISDSGKLFISTDSKIFDTICSKTGAKLKSADKSDFAIMRLGGIKKIRNEIGDESRISASDLAEACSCFYSFSSSSGKCSIAPRITSVEMKGDEILLRSDNSLTHVKTEIVKSNLWTTIRITGAFMTKSARLPKDAAFNDAMTSAKVEEGEIVSEFSINNESNLIFSDPSLPEADTISVKFKESKTPLVQKAKSKPQATDPETTGGFRPTAIKIPKAGSKKSSVISLKNKPKPASTTISSTSDESAPEIAVNRVSLTELTTNETEDCLEIRLTCSAPFAYKWLRFKVPDNRFLIEIPACKMALDKKEHPLSGAIADKVRVAQFEPGPSGSSRAVIDLKIPAVFELEKDGPSTLVFKFSNKSASPASMVMSGYGFTDTKAIKCNPDGVVICIDPGHGGSDSGAVNRTTGLMEKDVTLNISMKLADKLRKRGFTVIMTRTTDRDVSYAGSPDNEELGARVSFGKDADLFISIHINASANTGAHGFSTHWSKTTDKELADNIQFSLISNTKRRDRGSLKDRLYVTAYSKMPAVLVECGFISNDEESEMLTDDKFIDNIVDGIAEGIEIYMSRNPKQ